MGIHDKLFWTEWAKENGRPIPHQMLRIRGEIPMDIFCETAALGPFGRNIVKGYCVKKRKDPKYIRVRQTVNLERSGLSPRMVKFFKPQITYSITASKTENDATLDLQVSEMGSTFNSRNKFTSINFRRHDDDECPKERTLLGEDLYANYFEKVHISVCGQNTRILDLQIGWFRRVGFGRKSKSKG